MHPKLNTPAGIAQQRRNIKRSKERLAGKTTWLHGENFVYVCYGDVTELPLWRRRKVKKYA